jgi:hypothetical protein
MTDMYVRTTKEIAIYAGSKLKFGNDTKLSIESMTKITLPKPVDPPKNADMTDTKIWEHKVVNYVKREGSLDENLKTVYTIVYGQCTELLKTRLKTRSDFDDVREAGDVIALLGMIKKIVFSLDGDKYAPMAVYQAIRKLCNMKQQKFPLIEFLEHFNNQLAVVHQCGGTLTMPGVMVFSAASEEVDLATNKKLMAHKAEQRVPQWLQPAEVRSCP